MTNLEHMRDLTGCDLFLDITARFLMRYGVCPPGRVCNCHPTYDHLVCWEEWLNKTYKEASTDDNA